MKFVITGSDGFIGSYLMRRVEAVGLDRKSGNDILHMDLPEADVYFHLAAEPMVQNTINDPLGSFADNVLGTMKVLETCRQHNAKIVFASSSQATEDAENPYGLHKYTCEKFIKLYHDLYGVDYAILKFYNVFGGGGHSAVEALQAKANRGEPLEINGGQQTRDFIHIDAVVNELAKAIDKSGTWEVGSGESISIQELADLISDNQIIKPLPIGEPLHIVCATPTEALDVREYLK